MDQLKFNLSDPLSLSNIRACLEASRLAYASPTYTDLASGESVFIEDCGNCVVVAFPGTHDLKDVCRDLDCLRREVMIAGRPCAVHKGFDDTFQALQGCIVKMLKQFNASTPLFFTGHSKGAAVAKRFAVEFALADSALHNPHSAITFGEPRGGDFRYRAIYDSVFGHCTLRITNAADPVPWMPAWIAGNRHCGPEGYLPPDNVRTLQRLNGATELVVGPKLWWKVLLSAGEIYRAWRSKEIALLADHHISSYIQRVDSLGSMEAPSVIATSAGKPG